MSLDDFLLVVSDDEFEEIPVDLTTFVTHRDYMNAPRLSDRQYQLVERLTQIYYQDTLERLYGPKDGAEMARKRVNEVVAQVGKGGGKNFSTTIAVCRIIYLLMCLKDPAAYYGKPSGDAIDILNVAINSNQAYNTFFKPVRERIKRCQWFDGRYDMRQGEIRFDKNITLHSGHSEREAWEGYNFIMVVLDEIAGFRTDAEVTGSADRANSASALYKMYKASVASRFPDVGKIALLSFPRFKGDYITQRYEEVVAEKNTERKSITFKLNDDLPDGVEGNHFTLDWVEDHIISYKEPRVFAAKMPTWEFNPLRSIDDFKMEFWRDPIDAKSRFACNPPDSIDAFFKDRERVKKAFSRPYSPFNPDWSFDESFKPQEGVRYYIHCDLAEKSDRAAVAMSHVADWVNVKYGKTYQSIEPVIKLDCVRWWTPKSDKNVEFSDIKDFILSLRSRGFDIQMVTFDRWAGSISLAKELERVGITVDTLSVAKKEYNDMSLLISEERLDGYLVPLLVDELLGLRVVGNGKVDHTRSGTNDLADAVCGSVHLAAHLEEDFAPREIDIEFMDDMLPAPPAPPPEEEYIPPPPPMPSHLEDFLANLEVI